MQLSHLAHTFWCARLTKQGWKYGPKYDPKLRTHDCLVPFDRLHARDKKLARAIMEMEEFQDKLADAIEYPRGPLRPFIAEELVKGLKVGWAPHIRRPGRDAAAEVGTIESWDTDPVTHELTLMRVRWGAGDLTEHLPDEGDLRRLEPS